jgi:hypothetical protein
VQRKLFVLPAENDLQGKALIKAYPDGVIRIGKESGSKMNGREVLSLLSDTIGINPEI